MLRGKIGPVMEALLVTQEVSTYLVGPGEALEIKKKKLWDCLTSKMGRRKK